VHRPEPIKFFTHGTTLAYRSFGHGPSPLIALHGFGRTGDDFHVLQAALGDSFTIHAFDLHFHGQSPGYPQRANEPFTAHELAAFFTAFIASIGAERASILGYSLGGRIAMSLMEQMPERIDRLLLVAPDGLKTRPWYRSMAASRVGRWAYKRFVSHPERVHFTMDALRALRLMNERMHRFLKGQTDSRAKRMLVHDVWLSYRGIEPDLRQVGANAESHRIPVHLFFGEFDRVIPPQLGRNLVHHARQHLQQHVLPFGHVLLNVELGAAVSRVVRDEGAVLK